MIKEARVAYKEMADIKRTKEIFLAIKDMIENNQDLLERAEKIDLEHGGKVFPIHTVMNNLDEMAEMNEVYKEVIEMYGTEDNYIVGSHYEARGVLGAIYDGDPFATFDLMIKAIKTHNALILFGYKINLAMNKFLVEIVSKVLEANGYPKNLIQFTTDINDVKKVDKLIVIGNREEQDNYEGDIIKSGYYNYEIYVDKNVDNELIKRIANMNLPITIYSKEDLEVDYIKVMDIEEAIRIINRTGSMYAVSIFTDDVKLGEKFLKEINAKTVLVNSSPTIERSLRDIKLKDLMVEKTMFYPSGIKFTEKEAPVVRNVKEEIKKNEEVIENINQDDVVAKLEERLRESNALLKKYTEAFNSSFVARLVTGIKKEELVSDIKLLDS